MASYSATLTETVAGTDAVTRKLTSPRRIRDFASSRRNPAYSPNLANDPDIEMLAASTVSANLGHGFQNTGTSQAWSVTTEDSHSGIQALKLAPTITSFLGVQQTVDILPNTPYTISVWLRRGAGSGTIQPYSYWGDGAGVRFLIMDTRASLAVSSAWSRYTFTGTSPAWAYRCQFAFVYPGGSTAGDVLYIDDLQIEAASAATPFDPQHVYDTLSFVAKVGTVNYRPIAESAASNGYCADDSVGRALSNPRSLTESITGTSDSVAKRLTSARSVAEAAGAATDAATRQVILARSIAEMLATGDAPTRHVTLARSLAEALASASDVLTRQASSSRSLSEMLSVADEVDRIFAGSCQLVEDLSTLDAVLARRVITPLKHWNGSAWVSSGALKHWDGSAYVLHPLYWYRPDGSRRTLQL